MRWKEDEDLFRWEGGVRWGVSRGVLEGVSG